MAELEHAARILVANRLSDSVLDVLPPSSRPVTELDAYAVQDRVHELLTDGGLGDPVGYKIGCTTPVMQQYLGIGNPCAGMVFSSTVFTGHGDFRHRGTRRLGVECEIAVRLSGDLPARAAPYTRDDVYLAVGECMASIEVVEDRYRDYPDLDTPTLIADDFFNAGLVLGHPVSGFDAMDLALVTASMTVDGTVVGSGVGTDVMEHPLDALAWLATSLSARGVGMTAGQAITLGSLVQTNWVQPGSTVSISNDLLGPATAAFL